MAAAAGAAIASCLPACTCQPADRPAWRLPALPCPAPCALPCRPQAQRDFFGSHTYERTDGKEGWFHTGGWVCWGGSRGILAHCMFLWLPALCRALASVCCAPARAERAPAGPLLRPFLPQCGTPPLGPPTPSPPAPTTSEQGPSEQGPRPRRASPGPASRPAVDASWAGRAAPRGVRTNEPTPPALSMCTQYSAPPCDSSARRMSCRTVALLSMPPPFRMAAQERTWDHPTLLCCSPSLVFPHSPPVLLSRLLLLRSACTGRGHFLSPATALPRP